MAPLKHNLVALGSAAVLSVYAAGYARTRSAAQQFADEAVTRRPVHRPATDSVAPSVAATTAPPQTTPPSTLAPAPQTEKSPATKRSAKTRPSTPVAKAVDSAPPVSTPVAPPAAPVVAVQPPPPVKDSTVKAATAQTADSAQNVVGYKDGMYTGWGTSRHGDIQATVMIKEGKIVGAVISECLTQYSCSWIAALPQQVIDRQSAEVDYVSGATQSANAFYYAVLNALKKAK